MALVELVGVEFGAAAAAASEEGIESMSAVEAAVAVLVDSIEPGTMTGTQYATTVATADIAAVAVWYEVAAGTGTVTRYGMIVVAMDIVAVAV